jgi:threonine/homoserine/homoserine lactone efflux protein
MLSPFSFFLKGLIIGFAIAAPVGPIGVLCIRRTLADGRLIGFLSGLGAATADMCYGAIAAFGITALQSILARQQSWLKIIGGLFLIYLGVRAFLSSPAQDAAAVPSRQGRVGAYLSTFALTLMNPATIISFAAVFAGLRLAESVQGGFSPAAMVAGVFVGSAAWWLLLSTGIGLLRDRFRPAWMVWVNRISGTIICAFGVAALFSV